MAERFWATAVSRLEGSTLDGVHLLWVPPCGAGYSVRGFDIQRRASCYKPEIDCLALRGAELDLLHRRLWFANALATFSVNRGECPKSPPGIPDAPFTPDTKNDPHPRQCINFRRLQPGDGSNPIIASLRSPSTSLQRS